MAFISLWWWSSMAIIDKIYLGSPFLSEIVLGKKKRHEVGSGYRGELGVDLGGVNGECD